VLLTELNPCPPYFKVDSKLTLLRDSMLAVYLYYPTISRNRSKNALTLNQQINRDMFVTVAIYFNGVK